MLMLNLKPFYSNRIKLIAVFFLFISMATDISGQCVQPTSSDTSLCSPTSIALFANASSEFIRWYDSANGYSFLDTGFVYTTPIITSTRSYYVSQFDTGMVNQSLLLDGVNDYCAIANNSYENSGNTAVTVEAWINTSSGSDQIIVSYDRSEYWRLEINGAGAGTGQIGFDIYTDAGQLDFGGSIRVDDGLWHHVAAVYDNGTVSIYIDGTLDATTTFGSTFGTGTTRYGLIGVGSEADVYNGSQAPLDFFNGKIGLVRVWNVARTPIQIQQSMNSCFLGPQPNLNVSLQMNGSASQNYITDYSGNKNNAFLYNFTLPGAWQANGPTLYSCAICESTRDTLEVELVPTPKNFATNDTCIAGDSITLIANSGYQSYLWNDNSTNQTLNVYQTGNYSVKADTLGKYGAVTCVGTDSIRVYINPKPIGIDTGFCGQNNYSLRSTSSNGLYKWYSSLDSEVLLDTGKLEFYLSETDTFYVAAYDTLSKNNALNFTAANSNYAAINNFSYSSTSNTALTIETWINTTNGNDQIIASFDRSEYWRLEINGDGAGTGQIGFDIRTNSGVYDFSSISRVDDGLWHHVAAVFDNGSIRIYIDGVLDNSASNGATYGTGDLRYGFIGTGSEASVYNGSTGPNNFFDGSMATFNIWSRALSQTEIQNYRYSCRLGVEDGLEVSYNFTDGFGTLISDQTGRGRNAFLQNFNPDIAWNNNGPVIYSCPGPCESERDTVIAILNIIPKPDLGVDICSSTPQVIDAGANYSNYLWNTLETTQTIMTTAAKEGQFTVIVDSLNTPCQGFDTIISNIILVPNATDTALCGSGIANFSATAEGNSFKWYNTNNEVVATSNRYRPLVSETDTFTVSAVECDTLTNGLQFDGIDDYVALNMFYNSTGQIPQITLEAWVKTTENTAGYTDNWSIIDFDRSDYYSFYVHGDGRVGFSTTDNSGSTNDFWGPTGKKVNDGNWHHIAAVYDGTDKLIYVDGILASTLTNPHAGRALGVGSTRYGFIGDGSEATTYNGSRNNQYFKGAVAEVRVWNEVRTADKIAALKDFCLDGTEPNLAAYYKTTEVSGSGTLTDHSTFGRSGTLFNLNTTSAWINTAQERYCNCCESDKDTSIVVVNEVITNNEVVVNCPGIDSTLVNIKTLGGTGNYDYRELTGEFSYDASFESGSWRKRLINNSAFQVEIKDENECLDTTIVFNTPATPTTLANSNSTGVCRIFDQGEFAFIVNGSNQVIAAIKSENEDLGAITGNVYIEPNAQLFDGEAYLGRHFLINSDSNSFSTAQVRLFYTDTEFNNLIDSAAASEALNDDLIAKTELGVTKYNGSTEDGTYDPTDATNLIYIPQSGSGTSFGSNYLEFSLTSFSEFWIHASNSNSPLPINLISFEAEKQVSAVKLLWITASEINNDYFILERADNNLDFYPIAKIEGAGNSNQILNYQYLDYKEINAYAYYRLKQVDFNGESSYSKTLAVTKEESSDEQLILYPNPTKEILNIKHSFEQMGNFEVIDASGAIQIESRSNNSNNTSIDISALKPGVYLLKFTTGQTVKVKRFIVYK